MNRVGPRFVSQVGAIRPIPRNLASLQAGRAVAAILVVLFHTSVSIFALPKYWGAEPFGRIFDFGDSGVFFFFVLSGFIILHAHYRDLNCAGRVKDYVWKRFRRIYPIYWVVLALILPAYYARPALGKGFETNPEVILSSLFLLHFGSSNAVILVSWTLFHEILFYALFAVAIWRARPGLVILGGWLALSIIGLVTTHSSLLTGFYFSNLHLLFGFGLAAAWWVRRGSVPAPAAVTLLGLAIFLLAGADEVDWNQMQDVWRALVFGFGATLIVLGLVELERSGKLAIPGWLRLLGDASYSIYLVHFFVLSLLAKLILASFVGRHIPPIAAYIMLVSLAVLAGTLWHLGVERPLLFCLSRRPAAVAPA